NFLWPVVQRNDNREKHRLDFLFDMILIPFGRITRKKFGNKSRHKQLRPDQNSYQRWVKQRLICNITIHRPVRNATQLFEYQIKSDKKANQKAQHTYCTKKVHRAFTEFSNKEDRKQI